jgi:predicted nucleic acid-binding protein
LVTRLDIRGTKVHDARIAATLFRHGVTHLLTWDGGDFKRFQFLTCLSPEEVLKGTHGIA